MPRLVNAQPKYRHHKPSGRAVVTIDGHTTYLDGVIYPTTRHRAMPDKRRTLQAADVLQLT